MIDPLALVFIPNVIAMLIALASPVAVFSHLSWRRRGRKRNAEHRCARCARPFEMDTHFLFSGVYVCEDCAAAFRSLLVSGIPLAIGTAVVLAVTAGTGFIASRLTGGPSLGWWLDGGWIALVFPSTGVVIATVAAVLLGKRANRIANVPGLPPSPGVPKEKRLTTPFS